MQKLKNTLFNNHTSISIHQAIAYTCIVFYSIWLYLPTVQNALGVRAAMVCMLVFFINVLLDKNFIAHNLKSFILTIGLSIFLSAYLCIVYTVGMEDFIIAFPQIFMIFFPILAAFYFRKNRMDKYLLRLIFIIFIVNVITSVINVYWLQNNSHTARALGYGDADEEYLRRAMSYGIGGFGFSYGLLIPINFILFAIGYFKKKLVKISLIFSFILMSFAVLMSSYFIAAILFVFSIMSAGIHYLVFSVFKNKKYSLWYLIIILLLILVLILIFHSTIFDALQQILSNFGLTDYAGKIADIQSSLNHSAQLDTDPGRINDYKKSIDTIIKSPWIGIRIDNHHEISRHSTILDLFADSGIPAGLLFISALLLLLKIVYGDFWKSEYSYIAQWLWIIIMLISLLNVIIFVREAFVLLAFIPLYFEIENKR